VAAREWHTSLSCRLVRVDCKRMFGTRQQVVVALRLRAACGPLRDGTVGAPLLEACRRHFGSFEKPLSADVTTGSPRARPVRIVGVRPAAVTLFL
jgi:hypothetical protein